MENTSAYLQKEVLGITEKISSAKGIMMNELGVNLFKEHHFYEDKQLIEKEIREEEEEFEDD